MSIHFQGETCLFILSTESREGRYAEVDLQIHGSEMERQNSNKVRYQT
jgi:hypothetical protein